MNIPNLENISETQKVSMFSIIKKYHMKTHIYTIFSYTNELQAQRISQMNRENNYIPFEALHDVYFRGFIHNDDC